nr:hypothetical protein [Comamonas koreensis]
MMIGKYFVFIFFAAALNVSAKMKDECGAFFIKNGVMAAFPIKKNRDKWIWYKKERPEYAWIAETGFYENGVFKGNGFGFIASIGSANLKNTPMQQGTLQELIDFPGKNAFLTKDSTFHNVESLNDLMMYSSQISAKVIVGEFIMLGTQNPEAVRMAKLKKPTHMKLQAILPESIESYMCYPEIESIN